MAKMLFSRSEINNTIHDVNICSKSKRKSKLHLKIKWDSNECPFKNCSYVCKSGKTYKINALVDETSV